MGKFGLTVSRFRRVWAWRRKRMSLSAMWRGLRDPIAPAIGMVLLMAAGIPMPAQDVTLHVDVRLVNVFVNVTDAHGAIVGGLTQDDFAVSEDGRPQKIAIF